MMYLYAFIVSSLSGFVVRVSVGVASSNALVSGSEPMTVKAFEGIGLD